MPMADCHKLRGKSIIAGVIILGISFRRLKSELASSLYRSLVSNHPNFNKKYSDTEKAEAKVEEEEQGRSQKAKWDSQAFEGAQRMAKEYCEQEKQYYLIKQIMQNKIFRIFLPLRPGHEEDILEVCYADRKIVGKVFRYYIKMMALKAIKLNRLNKSYPVSEQTIARLCNEIRSRTKKALKEIPTVTRYYTITPRDYLYIWDIPLLHYCGWLKANTDDETLLEFECPERYSSIFDKSEACFGLEFIGSKDNEELQIPRFCEMGRLEAYKKFILDRGRIEDVHSFQYHASILGENSPFKGSVFWNENIWYLEMCSGVSLVAELASLVEALTSEAIPKEAAAQVRDEEDELQEWVVSMVASFREKKTLIAAPSKSPSWKVYYKCCAYIFLYKNRELITTCPAAFWRISVVRKMLYKLSEYCLELYGKVDTETDLGHSEGELFEKWIFQARKRFGTIVNEACQDVVRSEFRQQIESYSQDRPDGDKPMDTAPINANNDPIYDFLGKIDCSPTRGFDFSYNDALLAQTATLKLQEQEESESCLKFCISRYEPGVQYFLGKARTFRTNKKAKKKLRDRNIYEKTFRTIHYILYGNGDSVKSTDELGFCYHKNI